MHEVTYTAKKPNDICELHNCGLSVPNESLQCRLERLLRKKGVLLSVASDRVCSSQPRVTVFVPRKLIVIFVVSAFHKALSNSKNNFLFSFSHKKRSSVVL